MYLPVTVYDSFWTGEIQRGRESREIARFQGHVSAAVSRVVLLPDHRRILAVAHDPAVFLWELPKSMEPLAISQAPEPGYRRDAQEKPVEIARFAGLENEISCLAIAPDGKRVFTGSPNRTITTWDTKTGAARSSFRGHTNPVTALALSPDGRRVLSAGGAWQSTGGTWDEYHVILWDAATGREIRHLKEHKESVQSLAFSPDGRRVLTGDNEIIVLWDASGGKELRRFRVPSVQQISFSLNAQHVVTVDAFGMLRIWDAESGREIRAVGDPERNWVNKSVALNGDGKRALFGTDKGPIRLVEAEGQKEICQLLGHSGEVFWVAFTPEGRRAVSAARDRKIILWDLERGQELQRIELVQTAEMTSVALATDGHHIAIATRGPGENAAGAGPTIHVWDIGRGTGPAVAAEAGPSPQPEAEAESSEPAGADSKGPPPGEKKPSESRRPATLLARAKSFEKNNKPNEAIRTYEQLVKEFPQAPEVKEATSRLAALGRSKQSK